MMVKTEDFSKNKKNKDVEMQKFCEADCGNTLWE